MQGSALRLRAACVAGIATLAALVSPGASEAAAGAWYRFPLPGAEVKSLVADPKTPGAFYLGTAQGGVYRSFDAGRTWRAPSGGSPFPGYSVTAIAVDPFRSSTLWFGLTGVLRGGLLARSDDRGESFQVLRRWEERAAARVVAVAVWNGRRVLAVGGDYGVEISNDDGQSFRVSTPPLDPGSGVSFLAFPPSRPATLICGSFRHPFRSTDMGETWSRISNGMVEDTQVFWIDFSPADANDAWAATCGWVYRTMDGGANWTRYREGLADRRTHVVRRDPAVAARVLAGTTGGLFESRDEGKSFRRIGPELVVNALVFDPNRPGRLLIGTESEGVLISEDGGVTVSESNAGLAEARVSAVVETRDGRVVVARAADGRSGGLWEVRTQTGEATRLKESPPATIVALTAAGDRLIVGTAEGVFIASEAEKSSGWTRTLEHPTQAFLSGKGTILAATAAGVFESADGGLSFRRAGSLGSRVDSLRRVRLVENGLVTVAAESGGRLYYWSSGDWASASEPEARKGILTGGFGRPRKPRHVPASPVGLEVDSARSLAVFHPENEPEAALSLPLPERGLTVVAWSGDPRRPGGLYLATMGRGLFRFVPGV